MSHLAFCQIGLDSIQVVLYIFILSVPIYCVAVGFSSLVFGLEASSHIWVSFPPYMLFVIVYYHVFSGIDRSVSIRIMGELTRLPNSKVDVNKLEQYYPQADMLQSRLDLLVSKGMIEESRGFYRCHSKTRFFARGVVFLTKAYALDKPG